MDKYFVFRQMLNFRAYYAEVDEADMNWCVNTIKIIGENDGQTIEIEITIKEKEVEQDA